VTSFALIALSI